MLSDLMAVTFILQFEVEINRKEKYTLCMGNQVFMPSTTDKGLVIDDIMTLQLNKGPGENYANDLILSEESVLNEFNVFDIIIQGQIS